MNKIVTGFIGVIAITALGVAIFGVNDGGEIAYFDYNKVYNNSDIKNRLEADLKKVGSSRQSELDSLQMELSFMSKRISGGTASVELDEFETMKERFLTLQQRYEEESIRLKETYFNQIREEINKSAREFAESRGYDYLLAGMGDGTLMYGDKAFDVTDEFEKYVNQH